jgi:hypothetical protein
LDDAGERLVAREGNAEVAGRLETAWAIGSNLVTAHDHPPGLRGLNGFKILADRPACGTRAALVSAIATARRDWPNLVEIRASSETAIDAWPPYQ